MFLLPSRAPVFQELHRGCVAEGRVKPLTIVEHLDVLEGVGLHRLLGGEAFPEDPFVFQAIEPALGWGVVPVVALAAHRAEHAVL
jgi:hypothetical protein